MTDNRQSFTIRFIASFTCCFLLGAVIICTIPIPTTSYAHPLHLQKHLYARSKSAPDIVFIGSSRTAWGIAPDHVDPILSAAWGKPVKSFNFGLGAGNAMTYRFVVDNLTRSPSLPDLAVLGISPTDVCGINQVTLATDVGAGATPGRLIDMIGEFTDFELTREFLLSSAIPGRNRWPLLQQLWICARDGLPRIPHEYTYHDDGWLELAFSGNDRNAISLQRQLARAEELVSHPLCPTACNAFDNALMDLHAAGITAVVYEDPLPPFLTCTWHGGVYAEYREWLENVTSKHGVILIHSPFPDAQDSDFIPGAHVAPWAVQRYSRSLALALADLLPSSRPVISARPSAATAVTLGESPLILLKR